MGGVVPRAASRDRICQPTSQSLVKAPCVPSVFVSHNNNNNNNKAKQGIQLGRTGFTLCVPTPCIMASGTIQMTLIFEWLLWTLTCRSVEPGWWNPNVRYSFLGMFLFFIGAPPQCDSSFSLLRPDIIGSFWPRKVCYIISRHRLRTCSAIKILGDNGDLKYCAGQLMIKYQSMMALIRTTRWFCTMINMVALNGEEWLFWPFVPQKKDILMNHYREETKT